MLTEPRSIKDNLKKTIYIHTPLFVIVVVLFGFCVVVAYQVGMVLEIPNMLRSYFLLMSDMARIYLTLLFVTMICWRAIYIMFYIRPEQLIRYFLIDIKNQCIDRIFLGLPTLIILPIFFSTYTTFKIMMPHIYFFNWDEIFTYIDSIIHLGTPPWVLLQPYLGDPHISYMLDLIYHPGWFFCDVRIFNLARI